MNDQHTNYLLQLLPKNKQWITDLETVALREKIPIMEPLSMHFLTPLLPVSQPRSVLEIGTGIGYSALRMNDGCRGGLITTLERDEHRFNEALRQIKQHRKEENISVIFGESKEILSQRVAKDVKY